MTGRHDPRGLPHYEQTAVEVWRRGRMKLHSTLGNEAQGDLLQNSPLMEVGLEEGIGMGTSERGGVLRKGRQ